jgi:hypothetical protein
MAEDPPVGGGVLTGEPPTRPMPLPPRRDDRERRRRRAVVSAVVAIVAALAVVAALVIAAAGDDDDGPGPTTTEAPATTAPATVTTAAPTTGAPTSTATTTAPTTTAAPTTTVTSVPPAPDTSTAVFPSAGSNVRYADPQSAARGFATDLIGFARPVVGTYRAGDSRSGEIDVRPAQGGPVTTVLVRQLGADGTWWVLGAATAHIEVTSPTTGALVASPLSLRGSALAWEGVVDVDLLADGSGTPIGSTTVMGGGDSVRPFTGELTFTRPAARYGALVARSSSGRDGSVVEATVLRVRFR